MRSRRCLIAVILCSMLLQAVSMSGRWAIGGSGSEALHTVLHWTRVFHHHDHAATAAAGLAPAASADDEGFEAFAAELAQATLRADEGYHRDLSLDSWHHLAVDAAAAAVAILPSVLVSPLLTVRAVRPVSPPRLGRADPFLDGPRRPPRARA